MEDFIPPNCPSVSLPQMKISRNESSFPFYLQRQNCGNDRSLLWRKKYVYVYYIYVYIYVYVYKYVYIYIYIYTHTHTYTYICICVYIDILLKPEICLFFSEALSMCNQIANENTDNSAT